jgi:glycosyltransferase 2 family protein
MVIKSKLLKNGLAAIFIGGAFFFLCKIIYDNSIQLAEFKWNVDLFGIFFSLCLLCIPMIMLAYGWCMIIKLISGIIMVKKGMKIYMISQLGRYIPGKIFMFLGRIVFAEKMGIEKGVATISVFLEAMLSTLGAVLALFVLVPFLTEYTINMIDFRLTLFIFISVILILRPKFIRFALIHMGRKKKTGFEPPFLDNLSYFNLICLCGYYVLLWLIVGGAFYLLVYSVIGSSIEVSQFFDIAFLFLLSWLIGFLSIITPGGIGVRETVLAVSLEKIVPIYLSSFIAILARIWFTVAECMGILIIFILLRED